MAEIGQVVSRNGFLLPLDAAKEAMMEGMRHRRANFLASLGVVFAAATCRRLGGLMKRPLGAGDGCHDDSVIDIDDGQSDGTVGVRLRGLQLNRR